MNRDELLGKLAGYRREVQDLRFLLRKKNGVMITKDVAEAVTYATMEQIRGFKLTTRNQVEDYVMERVRANVQLDQALIIVNDMEHELDYRVFVETFSLRDANYAQEALYDGACRYVYERTMVMLKDDVNDEWHCTLDDLETLRKCEFCHEVYSTEDAGTLNKEEDGFNACIPCTIAHVDECQECGKLVRREDIICTDDGDFCPDCYEEWAVNREEQENG
jgi:hypothetical protein